jgi:hypothetical protein
MTAARLQFTIVLALVAAGIAFPCLLYYHALREHRQRDEMLQHQSLQLAELSAENGRLSNLVAQAPPPTLADAQHRELLKLRGGIGQLRQTAKEIEQLRAANQKLSNSPAPAIENSPARPEPNTILTYWPKDQLTPAGYADAQSALKTFLSAITRGDADALFASITVPADAKAELEEQLKTEEGRAAAGKMAKSFAAYTAFYITGQRMPSDNRTILDVFFEGDGKTRKVALDRAGQEWKLKAIGRPGQTDEDLENASFP